MAGGGGGGGRGGGKARLDTDCCEGDCALEGRSTSEQLAGPRTKSRRGGNATFAYHKDTNGDVVVKKNVFYSTVPGTWKASKARVEGRENTVFACRDDANGEVEGKRNVLYSTVVEFRMVSKSQVEERRFSRGARDVAAEQVAYDGEEGSIVFCRDHYLCVRDVPLLGVFSTTPDDEDKGEGSRWGLGLFFWLFCHMVAHRHRHRHPSQVARIYEPPGNPFPCPSTDPIRLNIHRRLSHFRRALPRSRSYAA